MAASCCVRLCRIENLVSQSDKIQSWKNKGMYQLSHTASDVEDLLNISVLSTVNGWVYWAIQELQSPAISVTYNTRTTLNIS